MTENQVENVEHWCMKCKSNQKMKEAKKVITRNNRNAIKGRCTVCGTKMFKFTK